MNFPVVNMATERFDGFPMKTHKFICLPVFDSHLNERQRKEDFFHISIYTLMQLKLKQEFN